MITSTDQNYETTVASGHRTLENIDGTMQEIYLSGGWNSGGGLRHLDMFDLQNEASSVDGL